MDRLIFIGFFIFAYVLGNGQEVRKLWEEEINNTELQEIIQLPDGKIVAVGESEVKGLGKQGVFLELSPKSGKVLKREFYGGTKDDSFYDLVECEDGTYYIVGSRKRANKKDSDAWFLHLGEDGKTKLKDTIIGSGGTDYFRKIGITDDGKALIAGFKNYTDNGDIWLAQYKDGQLSWHYEPLGNGGFENIIGLEKSGPNQFWLSGNTRKSKDTKPNNIWTMGIDLGGQLKIDNVHEYGGDYEDQINQSALSYDGNVLLYGHTNRSKGWDGWILEINEDSNKKDTIDLVLTKEEDNIVKGMLKMRRNHVLLILENLPDPFGPSTFKYELVYWNRMEKIQKFLLAFESDAPFDVKRIFRTRDNTFLIAGTEEKKKSKKARIINVEISDQQNFFSKSFFDINSKIGQGNLGNAYSIGLEGEPTIEGGTNGLLLPGGRGPLSLTIANNGPRDYLEGLARIKPVSNNSGIVFKRNEHFLPYLPKNGQLKLNFPIIPNNDLVEGEYRFDIAIDYDGAEVANFPVRIKVANKMPVMAFPTQPSNQTTKSSVVTYTKPDINANKGKNFKTTENTYKIQQTIFSSQPRLKANDIKVVKNSKAVNDAKSRSFLSKGMEEGAWFRYNFTFEVSLDDLTTEIYTEVDGVRSAQITIEKSLEKPNLFVLAIAPEYQDLKYTQKDAQDFVNAISKQDQINFFDQIIVKTLLTKEETTKSNIEKTLLYLSIDGLNGTPMNKDNDILIVFYSGHGINVRENGDNRFKLVPGDYDDRTEKARAFTSIDYRNDVLGHIRDIDAKKLVFIDACLSGSAKSGNTTAAEVSDALNRISQAENGLVTLSSCSSNELSYEDKEWENGAFTEAILEALNYGSAILSNGDELLVDQNKNGFISISEMYDFLRARVPDLVTNRKGENQHPYIPAEQLDLSLDFFKTINE